MHKSAESSQGYTPATFVRLLTSENHFIFDPNEEKAKVVGVMEDTISQKFWIHKND